MYRLLLILGVLFALSTSATAQSYNRAIGLRFGHPLSVTYKQFLNPRDAVELYAGWWGWKRYRAFSLNGAYQVHRNFAKIRNLRWYYGLGAGVQFWEYERYDRGNATVSVSGYLGLEYLLPDIPFTITLDWRPTAYLGRHREDDFHYYSLPSGGLAVRYVF